MTSIFTNSEQKKIDGIYQSLGQYDEFEFMFNNYNENPLTISNFLDILKYLTYRSKIDNLSINTSMDLDITYNYKEGTNNVYRVTISSLDSINKLWFTFGTAFCPTIPSFVEENIRLTFISYFITTKIHCHRNACDK